MAENGGNERSAIERWLAVRLDDPCLRIGSNHGGMTDQLLGDHWRCGMRPGKRSKRPSAAEA
jgi:hypothetical protein